MPKKKNIAIDVAEDLTKEEILRSSKVNTYKNMFARFFSGAFIYAIFNWNKEIPYLSFVADVFIWGIAAMITSSFISEAFGMFIESEKKDKTLRILLILAIVLVSFILPIWPNLRSGE